tara:strand:+ start:790 stop:1413 length:624 start_codon:yes stop_codon:yes gene_type:complete
VAIVENTLLKEYLPEIQGSGIDAELTALISRVETAIARYLSFPEVTQSSTVMGPTLDSHAYTFHIDGPQYMNPMVLQLPVKPVTAITSIHSDPDRQYTSDTLIDASTYTFNKHTGQVFLDPISATNTFDRGFRAIKAVVTAGFTTATAPHDLKHAICVWASQIQRNKSAQGRNSISQRGGSITASPKTIPEEVKELLYPFRVFGAVL